ncbi:hypothetical protein CLV92_10354 [Kineococcus xinjiangensis]|uniref:Uncharacterized protein n=1 Tax=Kineococcus xinjiangensis TaxID=512762 RepID=A0A2S6ITM4_9ACTN|nr:hypothetical protein [Kineococcus xinjiangensis]PPK97521.1 hypothetical protein CLV92_10354 [Kineococcus xinjiangensis]
MFAPLAVAGPALLLLLTAGIAALAVLAARPADRDLVQTVAAARRHGTVFAALAVLAGLGVTLAAAMTELGGLRTGQLLAVAPLGAALGHTLVLAVGELTWPRPRARRRSARLRTRRLHDVAPRWLSRSALASAAALALTCAAGALLADADGRSVSYSWPDLATSGGGPFPGWFYGGPVLLAGAIVTAAVLAALRLVLHRPAVEGADAATDEALRRASGHRLLRGATAAALLTTGALLWSGGHAAQGLGVDHQIGDEAPVHLSVPPPVPMLASVAQGAGSLLVLAAPALLAVPPRPLRRAGREPAAPLAVPTP